MKIVTEYTTEYKTQSVYVSGADYLGNFKICVTFSNGTKQTINFKPFLEQSLHPSISKYMDENRFKNFQIKDGNINWNDYDLIFPVEHLYNGEI